MKKLISYVVVFVVGFAVCAYVLMLMGYSYNAGSKQSVMQALTSHAASPVVKGRNPIADAAAKVGPSVVSIYTTAVREVRNPLGQFFSMPGLTQKQLARGAGSGVIISNDGYILTNNHVVSGAQDINVSLSDGRSFKARLIGKAARSDVAVIKINAKNLPAAQLGDSNSARVGDWAIAIGNPLGQLENTVTVGVISATKRKDMAAEGTVLQDVIQTDAAINPGNSGGALANIDGQVIGINTMIASNNPSQPGSIGIGFAIPINSAKEIAARIVKEGSIVYPFLGVSVGDLKGDYKAWFEQHGYNGKGAFISQISPGSPAEKAGLMQGDVIIDVNGRKIGSAADVVKLIQKCKVGEVIKLNIWRDGKNMLVMAKLAEMPQNSQ